MEMSGAILLGVIIAIANLKILVLTTGVKPFILVISLASIAIYWPTLVIVAHVTSLDQLANLTAQLYPGALFSQTILVFICVLLEFGYTKYRQMLYRYELMKSTKSLGEDLFDYILKK